MNDSLPGFIEDFESQFIEEEKILIKDLPLKSYFTYHAINETRKRLYYVFPLNPVLYDGNEKGFICVGHYEKGLKRYYCSFFPSDTVTSVSKSKYTIVI